MFSVISPLDQIIKLLFVEKLYVLTGITPPTLLFLLLQVTNKPEFGIAESGILTALSLGSSFGILAILDTSVPRHIRYIRSLGLEKRLSGDLAIGLGVAELSDEKKTFHRLLEVGRKLRDNHESSVLILGCAGMARYRHDLQENLGIPVVDPSQAAVSMAVSAVLLN